MRKTLNIVTYKKKMTLRVTEESGAMPHSRPSLVLSLCIGRETFKGYKCQSSEGVGFPMNHQ